MLPLATGAQGLSGCQGRPESEEGALETRARRLDVSFKRLAFEETDARERSELWLPSGNVPSCSWGQRDACTC